MRWLPLAVLLALTEPSCAQRSPGANTQTAIAIQAVSQTAVEQKLDNLLLELGKALEPSESEALRSVQAEWVGYRDSHCEWQAGFFADGSIRPTIYETCIDELTWDRIDELKLDLCEGWGMTGECEASSVYDRPGEIGPR